MRDPERISRITKLLDQAWRLAPDLRLGQFLFNLSGHSTLFYIEDDDWEQRLVLFLDAERVKRGFMDAERGC